MGVMTLMNTWTRAASKLSWDRVAPSSVSKTKIIGAKQAFPPFASASVKKPSATTLQPNLAECPSTISFIFVATLVKLQVHYLYYCKFNVLQIWTPNATRNRYAPSCRYGYALLAPRLHSLAPYLSQGASFTAGPRIEASQEGVEESPVFLFVDNSTL